jgi:phytoene/squalene synthetase
MIMHTRAIRPLASLGGAQSVLHLKNCSPLALAGVQTLRTGAGGAIAPGRSHRHAVNQKREISILERTLISSDPKIRSDLERSISLVRKFDPSGYLPGLLLPQKDARVGYYAVRAFWIETGLRFKESPLRNSIAESRQIPGLGQRDPLIPDDERIKFWKEGVEYLYDTNDSETEITKQTNPTLRLLRDVVEKYSLSKEYFDQIIRGREIDVNMKHYPTIQSLETHAEMSCASLLNLVLECGGIHHNGTSNGANENESSIEGSDFQKAVRETAREVGIMHGLTNALRLSVPTASATGKVIVPQELCDKYGIKSPRYLLSALGMGDEECKKHLQSAVRDIVLVARQHLENARQNIDVLKSNSNSNSHAMSSFLPALASETFLNRLEKHQYDLTDRTLRSVGRIEHMQCAGSLVAASLQNRF